ncbi:MAG: RDD family protein [Parvibaculaceae bacterium]
MAGAWGRCDGPADQLDEPPALIRPNQWVDEAPHPWRRYVVRLLDNLIWGTLLLFIVLFLVGFLNPDLGLMMSTWFEGRDGQVGATVLMHLVAILPNALLIGLTGGNFGKWLCASACSIRQAAPSGWRGLFGARPACSSLAWASRCRSSA